MGFGDEAYTVGKAFRLASETAGQCLHTLSAQQRRGPPTQLGHQRADNNAQAIRQ